MVFWIFVIKMGLAKLSQTHFCSMAEGRGVEPRFTESESVVLPLNDPPITKPHSAESIAHSAKNRQVLGARRNGFKNIIALQHETFNPLRFTPDA